VFFTDQILVQGYKFSQGGDSGSLVMTTDKSIVGLLFAGSDEYTVVNKLKHVEELLNISLFVGDLKCAHISFLLAGQTYSISF